MMNLKFQWAKPDKRSTESRQGAKETGVQGEQMAARWLEGQGYTVIEKNYRYGHHEIDLVATEGSDLVIVEVKTRTDTSFGNPEEAVDLKKRKILVNLANRYVKHHHWQGDTRFDIVAITIHDNQPVFKLIKNAFNIFSYRSADTPFH